MTKLKKADVLKLTKPEWEDYFDYEIKPNLCPEKAKSRAITQMFYNSKKDVRIDCWFENHAAAYRYITYDRSDLNDKWFSQFDDYLKYVDELTGKGEFDTPDLWYKNSHKLKNRIPSINRIRGGKSPYCRGNIDIMPCAENIKKTRKKSYVVLIAGIEKKTNGMEWPTLYSFATKKDMEKFLNEKYKISQKDIKEKIKHNSEYFSEVGEIAITIIDNKSENYAAQKIYDLGYDKKIEKKHDV